MSSENVPILLFHRVCPKDDLPAKYISPRLFDQVLDYLASKYSVLSLEGYFFNERNKLLKPPVVITFDNSYVDFFEYTLPLLKKYNLTATLFVSASNIDQQQPPWNHVIDLLFLQSEKLSVAAIPFKVKFRAISSWKNKEDRMKYGGYLKKHLQSLSGAQRDQVINFYFEQLNDQNVKLPKVMDWNALRKIKQQGIEIGTHITSFNFKNNLFDEQQLSKELRNTTLRIREELGNSPAAVSFVSQRNNSKIKNMIHLSGYKLGLAIGNKPYNAAKFGRYSLPRIEMFNENIFISRWRINGTISRLKSLFGQ